MTSAEFLAWVRIHELELAIAAPLAGAALTALAPGRAIAWCVCLLWSVFAAAMAASAANNTLMGSAIPVAGVDGVALFAAPLVAVNAMFCVLAGGFLIKAAETRVAPLALALILGVSGGWTGALLSQSFVGLFMAVETASIACLALAALSADRERGALNGALRLLGASGLGSALLLLGLGLVERGAGVAGLHGLPLAHINAPDMTMLGVCMIVVALALKAGFAPLHMWAGAVFGRGSDLALLVLGAVNAVGAAAVIVRVAASASQAPAIGEGVAVALAALGAVGVLIGSVQAAGAKSLRRLTAYFVAAQGGGILVAVALGSTAGLSAAFLQLFALAATSLAMFGAAAAAPGDPARSLNAIDGLSRRAPLATLALTLSALSAMGAPLTLGFLCRWRLMEAGIGAGWWWTVGTAVAASLAGVFYGGRLIERLYFRRAAVAASGRLDPWRLALAPGLLVSILAMGLAVSPRILLERAAAAVELVLGTPQ